ncbi:hypothetical protein C8J57DRAFT_1320669 [Mycena rebaudengoi]|nr:hypothetical protein C8J57DRAFT_1320669 [Mycena rebaudengoi]
MTSAPLHSLSLILRSPPVRFQQRKVSAAARIGAKVLGSVHLQLAANIGQYRYLLCILRHAPGRLIRLRPSPRPTIQQNTPIDRLGADSQRRASGSKSGSGSGSVSALRHALRRYGDVPRLRQVRAVVFTPGLAGPPTRTSTSNTRGLKFTSDYMHIQLLVLQAHAARMLLSVGITPDLLSARSVEAVLAIPSPALPDPRYPGFASVADVAASWMRNEDPKAPLSRRVPLKRSPSDTIDSRQRKRQRQ